MVIDFKRIQEEKAKSPIEVTELEMATDVKWVQQEKAPSPIDMTE